MLFAPRSPAYRFARKTTRLLGVLAVSVLLFLLPVSATAISSSEGSNGGDGEANPFTGDPISVSIDVDSTTEPGHLLITLSVDGDDVIGDLRGLFLQVSDESLLDGLSVVGEGITSAQFLANGVTNLGKGSNLNGGGTPCPCDIGIEIGTPGIGRDDFQSVSFTLSHASEMLDASFLNQQSFGVRVTSVGDPYGKRNGSSKLIGVVPEPTTAILMLLGLAGLTVVGSPAKRRS
jgi:hypothetical protein